MGCDCQVKKKMSHIYYIGEVVVSNSLRNKFKEENILYHRLEHQKERSSSLWPTVGFTGSDHGIHGGYCPRGGKNFQNINTVRGRKSKGGKEFVVKIFVGVEYECPRGHRFMASAPDKVLKTTGNGIVKDSGNKVTSSTADMPLYFACPCRSVELYYLEPIF